MWTNNIVLLSGVEAYAQTPLSKTNQCQKSESNEIL